MNIFLRELKANRKALIIWCVCMFIGVLSGMSKYTAYSSGSSSQVFDTLPQTLKALLGIGSFDVTVMSGFFAFLFSYLQIATAIHAVLLGSGIIAKEERDKTAEFLMVKAVSRSTIITSKFLAALVNVVILNIVTLLSSIAFVGAFNKGKAINGEIAVFFLSMLLVQLIFLSLGAMFSAVMKNPKASGSLSVGVMFGAYAISKITDIAENLDILNILSPFKYFSYQAIVDGNGLNILIAIVSLLLVAAFCGCAYYFYAKRDLKV